GGQAVVEGGLANGLQQPLDAAEGVVAGVVVRQPRFQEDHAGLRDCRVVADLLDQPAGVAELGRIDESDVEAPPDPAGELQQVERFVLAVDAAAGDAERGELRAEGLAAAAGAVDDERADAAPETPLPIPPLLAGDAEADGEPEGGA